MELRSLVHLAGEAVAPFWPMRTFIHHNPLHGFEHLEFSEAVQRGEHLFGGRGYLPSAMVRKLLFRGRIGERELDAVLRTRARDEVVELAGRKLSHQDVLHVLLVHGPSAPDVQQAEQAATRAADRDLLESLARRLEPIIDGRDLSRTVLAAAHGDTATLGQQVSLSAWCDETFGTDLRDFINQSMIRWCAAFLDEGHATWTMPLREKTFYGSWRTLSAYDRTGELLGYGDLSPAIDRLPERPEDALLESLERLGIPKTCWSDYLSLHAAALPGWTGFIRWRAGRPDYPWQHAYPIDLVKYLAVRLFYERESVARACRRHAGIEGSFTSIADWVRTHPEEYFLRREQIAGRLPDAIAAEVDWLIRVRSDGWAALADRYRAEWGSRLARGERLISAWRILGVARSIGVEPAAFLEAGTDALRRIVQWIQECPEAAHGPIWLEALERTYQTSLVRSLSTALGSTASTEPPASCVRPFAQTVFCIDVRSEALRRHLEHLGHHETFGIAGFFAVPIRYQPFGEAPPVELCPVLVKPRHVVREIPRAYQGQAAREHLAMRRWLRAGKDLLHDLKENVITPYVMVETVGWAFSLPFLGKTVVPVWYRRLQEWLTRRLVGPVATTMTVDKLSREEAREMVAMEQRAVIRQVLRERLGPHGPPILPELVESLRREAVDELDPDPGGTALWGMAPADRAAVVHALRTQYGIDPRSAAQQLDRITQTGFTTDEQALFVETALRLIGLTSNFARLVLFCGHGSTSENNPYESALDCGACGGNHGHANARVLAAMANKTSVRTLLAQRGIDIPADTHFCAGEHDTTTDEIRLFDLEDVPPTHRHDLTLLLTDLQKAADRTRQERCLRLPDIAQPLSPSEAARQALRRSADWTQVRPEWGLSRNAAIIIGRRGLTKDMDLQTRTFLHSYDWAQDPRGKLLEIIMTGPLVVAQWINMEHYFSTVDNEVYGSGSKVYHNVVGNVGVMYGTQSDLRIGLSWQTVMDGDVPYHEPMRLTAVIEAPRDRITAVIRRNDLLQRLFDLHWVHLCALDPETREVYRYRPDRGWHPFLAGDVDRLVTKG